MAERAVENLRNCILFDEVEVAWSDFLHASHRIFTKLEVGLGSGGKEGYWWGRIKHKRKKDELLSYILHARNSDEHGINEIASRHSLVTTCLLNPGDPKGKTFDLYLYDEAGEFSVSPAVRIEKNGIAQEVEVVRQRRKLVLKRVVDRGRWYDPPTIHQGLKVSEPEAFVVADIGVSFLSKIIEEAEAFAEY